MSRPKTSLQSFPKEAKARHNVTCGEELRTAARDESSDVVPSQLKVEDTADLEASEEEVSTPEKECATDDAAENIDDI